MLEVTEDAKQLLGGILSTNTNDQDMGIRLLLKQNGKFEIALDKEAKGDQVIEYEGLKALLVGNRIVKLVAEATLDTEVTSDGTKLVISNK
jgi:Fe-S cluster assembly iron-binding protein IscA